MKYLLSLAALLILFLGLGFLAYQDQKTQRGYAEIFTTWTTFSVDGNWLDGTVSLIGGKLTKPRQAFDYAKSIGFGTVETRQELESLLAEGILVPLVTNRAVLIDDGVSAPFAQPLVRLFAERLGKQYQDADCVKLVVTSALRLSDTQNGLKNGSKWSVHPAGLAVDFRIPTDPACRTWLEKTLATIESHGRIDATREVSPAHYHVVVMLGTYGQYVRRVMSPTEQAAFVEDVLEER